MRCYHALGFRCIALGEHLHLGKFFHPFEDEKADGTIGRNLLGKLGIELGSASLGIARVYAGDLGFEFRDAVG